MQQHMSPAGEIQQSNSAFKFGYESWSGSQKAPKNNNGWETHDETVVHHQKRGSAAAKRQQDRPGDSRLYTRPKIGEHVRADKERKERWTVSPPDKTIWIRSDDTTVQMCGDNHVAEKRIDGTTPSGCSTETGWRKTRHSSWKTGEVHRVQQNGDYVQHVYRGHKWRDLVLHSTSCDLNGDFRTSPFCSPVRQVVG